MNGVFKSERDIYVTVVRVKKERKAGGINYVK